MTIGIPKESDGHEHRVPLIPDTVKKLAEAGAHVIIQKTMGITAGYDDDQYIGAGAQIGTRAAVLANADIILRIEKPPPDEVARLKRGAVHISYLDPFNAKTLVRSLASHHLSAISMELIPRITRTQKMDSLSSQASLAGYVAVILAAERIGRIFPMMVTSAGTLSPARVFIIGAGVAGLQAIATAHRLGARVEAFDTRPAVEEQVKSLGAKFIKIDLGRTGQTKNGYAKELTKAQLAKQQAVMANHCEVSDVVITTAQVFGRKAPRIVTRSMIDRMKPGSVVIDMAVAGGGNVEGSRLDREIEINGVRLIGYANLAGMVPIDASRMYSNNIGNLVLEFWDKENERFVLDLEDDIIKSCLVTHEGRVWNSRFKELYTS